MSLLAELKRRHVWRAGLAWLALAWLLVAMADLLFPRLGFPDEVLRWLIIGLLLMVVPVTVFVWLFELTPAGLRRYRSDAAPNPERYRVGRRTDQLIIVLILLALCFSALRYFVLPQFEHDIETVEPVPIQVEAPAVPPRPMDPRGIAVLPFANMSPDPANAFMAEGLAEELLNTLARIDGLRVASRTSSFAFRDAPLGARKVGERLGVAHVLDGSLRRQNDRVRITAQLIRAEDDRQIWSGSFERQLTDVFALQQDIAQAITDALADQLGVRTVQVRQATTDMQAYELYLRGRQMFAQRGDSLLPARELVQQALARDPDFAEAWAVLAAIELVLPSYFAATPASETYPRAAEAVERALALVPDQSEALAVSAWLSAERGERLQALARLRRALEQEPSNANTWMWLGLIWLEAGHIEAARQAIEQALALDPLSGANHGWLAATELTRGQDNQAEELLARAYRLGWRGLASAWQLKLALKQHGLGSDAAQQFQIWIREDARIPDSMLPVYRELLPAMGNQELLPGAADILAREVEQQPDKDWTHPYLFLGLIDEALAEALRPKPESGQLLLMMIWSPVDRAFREHPRFIEYADQQGLTEFWQAHGWPDHCTPTDTTPERLECSR